MAPVRVNLRDSNIELYRCIVMVLIVAHHYVMHSGVLTLMGANLTSANSIYLYLFGMWGKIGINCFVLITGYYMCLSKITTHKLLKLLFEVEFYKVVIGFMFFLGKEHPYSLRDYLSWLLPVTDVSNAFVDCFFVFYLFIPFLNVLINAMSQKQHLLLLALCLFVFSLWPQLYVFRVDSNYVVWFCIVYFIAAYIRKYKVDELRTYPCWGLLALLMVIIACTSVIVLTLLGKQWPYFFIHDCNKLLALLISVFTFMFFKHLPVRNSRVINNVGATTFGVLLIHDCNWDMRHWLWVDVCKNAEWYSNNVYVHSVLCVVGVFVICSLIDFLRINFLERPLFELLKR